MKSPQLLDRWGNPVRKADLKREAAPASITGVRSPISGYPADGLTPVRLATILREAAEGDPIRYLELAEAIEERDLHYVGVLGTRRRSVSQIEATVEAASDKPEDVEKADRIRDWLTRGELTDELFDILDAIGKGYSFTEIVWDTSAGQWQPARLEWRDPRWFRFARHDLTTPRMIADDGSEQPLRPFSFIHATIKAKSGLPIRSGLARIAAWAWMFKAFTQRDWAIFTQTYGQPLRVGKYGPQASEADRDTLFRAVANIAGDCAAIIPEGMQIDFIESKSVGASVELFRDRADWLDRQMSKAVLGQTATTDAVTGGLGSGKEHREVQKDIERADCMALAAVLNRDLIRPWIDLEYGPQQSYPRLVIARPETEDLAAFATAVGGMIDRGLEVEQSAIRDRFKLPEPAKGAALMRPAGGAKPPEAATPPLNGVSGDFKGGEAPEAGDAALNAEGASVALPRDPGHLDLLAARMTAEAQPAVLRMLEQIEAMVQSAGSLEELRAMLLEAYPALDSKALADRLAAGMTAARLAGAAAVEEGADG